LKKKEDRGRRTSRKKGGLFSFLLQKKEEICGKGNLAVRKQKVRRGEGAHPEGNPHHRKTEKGEKTKKKGVFPASPKLIRGRTFSKRLSASSEKKLFNRRKKGNGKKKELGSQPEEEQGKVEPIQQKSEKV